MSSAELLTCPAPPEQNAGELFERLASNLLQSGLRGRVNRLDIGRQGEMTVQVAVGGQQRWLRAEPGPGAEESEAERPGTFRELKASGDEHIPLSRQLTGTESGPDMTVLSYRPSRRLVLLDCRGAQTEVLKGYRTGKGEQSAQKYAFAEKGAIPGRFLVPGATRYYAENDYMAMPFVDGMPFQVSSERTEDFEDLGRGIRKLQGVDCPADLLAQFSREDELKVADERARRMRLIGCAIPEGWAELRLRLESLCATIPAAEHQPTHRDLHDGQVLRSPKGIALLDFDLLCRAEPELDPANFLAHLSLRRLQMPHRISDAGVQVCGKKFLDGLKAYERDGFWERLRFYQATSFLRLQLVYSLRPRWAAIVEPLGRLGHRCLDDLEHLAV